ncbi:dTDP-4-dehydrorhamnose 3,5-epimerase [Patescibacteria group bacterium]|nr:dTDP-4-dehydrorhamnose 3,5-epimerase [Patescibacteria group bacterium]
MEFKETKFKDAWIIQPKVFQDGRGFFLESYSNGWFADKGIDVSFIQDNHSLSRETAVLRGLHFQIPPHDQAKLVRVTAGKVYDVIVDIRKGSKTYGQWQGFELSAENFTMLFIPRGFAHGFCTLEPNTEFCYKVDNNYAPESDSGIIWNDATLNIDWPISNPKLSAKDSQLNSFGELKTPFTQ